METIAGPLLHSERVHADRPAVTDGERTFTYAALAERVRRVAGWLRSRTAPGDRIAVLAANAHPVIELYLGVPSSGRAIVPLNTRWAEPELAYALDDAGAVVLITDRDPGGLAGHVDEVVRLGDAYEALLAAAEPDPALGAGIEAGSLAGLFYTGGTTGQSKGVMLSHANLLANTRHAESLTPMTTDDAYLVIAPLFHAAGSNSVLQCVWRGAHQVVLAAFAPDAALDAVERHAITGTLGVPTMVAAMVETQLGVPRDVGSMRFFSHGGSPIALEVVRRAARAFPGTELVHLYGATETAPLLTGLRHEEQLVDTPVGRSCGPAVPGVEVRVVDPDGGTLPPGEVGEVVARGPNVMLGYWNKPEATDRALRAGWYWTGDVGYLDAAGHLFLVDRAKDMIISGGENVYCTEVENAIYEHPKVLEATVFGIPDDRWGEAVHAVVVRRDDTLTAAELIEHCHARIAGYKVPKSVEFHPGPLPVSGPGKVLKRELRRKYWEGQDRSIH